MIIRAVDGVVEIDGKPLTPDDAEVAAAMVRDAVAAARSWRQRHARPAAVRGVATGGAMRAAILEALGDGTATTARLAEVLGARRCDVEACCDAMWREGVLDRVVLPGGHAWRRATDDRWVGAMEVPDAG